MSALSPFQGHRNNLSGRSWLTAEINLWYSWLEQHSRSLVGILAFVLLPNIKKITGNGSPPLPSFAVLPSTWKVPFDSSSLLSFPCSCKRFCRCCRELDSPAANPLKWLFPSLQVTAPSFPLALWKVGMIWQSYVCIRLWKKEQKTRQRNQASTRALQASRHHHLFLQCTHTQCTCSRKKMTFLPGESKSLEKCCAAS